MTDKPDSSIFSGRDSHLAEGLLLKVGITDSEDLINHENFRVEMRCQSECQPDIHAAAVPFHRGIEKSLDVGENTISSNKQSLVTGTDKAIMVVG